MPHPDIKSHNRAAWNSEVEKQNQWTVPVSSQEIAAARAGDCRIVLTPQKFVPEAWLGSLKGKDVLCLAGGGGQQAPLLAAAGANVTTLDNSPAQLEQDQSIAQREGLTIKTVLGVMDDLSCFEDQAFDLIVHPCSNTFTPDVRPVWNEAFRVLRPGGELLAGFCNPLIFIFDYVEEQNGNLVVKHSIPYSDQADLDAETLQKFIDDKEPLCFGHSLEDQMAGQIEAGFVVTGFYTDRMKPSDDLVSKYIDTILATRSSKPGVPR